jgi:hypothetical protein
MSAPDRDVHAVKRALLKRGGREGASYIDDIEFVKQSMFPNCAEQAILIGHQNELPVYCYLNQKNAKPHVELVRKTSLGGLHGRLSFEEGSTIDLFEPLSLIVRFYGGYADSPKVYLSSFLKACFIATSFTDCAWLTNIHLFLKKIRRAVNAIESENAEAFDTAGTSEAEHGHVLETQTRKRTAAISRVRDRESQNGPHEGVSHPQNALDIPQPPEDPLLAGMVDKFEASDEHEEPVRQWILDQYFRIHRDHKNYQQKLETEISEYNARVVQLERLKAQVKVLQEEQDAKEREIEGIDMDRKETERSLRRLKRDMTGEEGYELAMREIRRE